VGVASILSALRDQMPGTAVFLFQPAEETIEGAAAMLDDGALDEVRPDAIYAIHSFPFQVGTIARDVDFGGLDRWTIEFVGAAPEAEVTERLVESLERLGTVARPGPGDVSTYLDQLVADESPLQTGVYVDVETKTRAGQPRIEVAVRAYSDELYPALRGAVTELLDAALGPARYRLEFRPEPFPSMRSDRSVSTAAAGALAEVVGQDHVLGLQAMHLFSGEDFALWLQRAPGAMFLVGVANHDRGILGAPHFPDFDVDEAAIPIAARAMARVLWQRLSQP
jgi:metal-dependent amidase/aminoacylase/carboxypeptidase family protein